MHFGTNALALDLEPGRGLTDAIENPSRIDGLFIERAMVRASDTLAILSAEAPISQPMLTDGGAFYQLLEEFQAAFECSVVDLPRGMLIQHPHLMGSVNVALVVTELTLAAARDTIRILSWLNPGSDRLGFGWQVTQGQYALGTGGFWGVGLGASREKWGTLPEAHTDFIYPVIGEELGLLGTLIVLALFSLLAFAIFRLSRNTDNSFVRYAAAGVGAWIVVQAVVNIGGVLGLLPVAGVTLPLVSYGGSSLIPTLTAIGMLMAFARQEPGARRALRRRSTAQALRRR